MNRYIHTLRYLKLEQVLGRVRHRLVSVPIDARPAPPVRPGGSAWVSCARAARMDGPRLFEFLSVSRTVGADWNDASLPKLWLYNLHYFDDLVADGAASRVQWHRALISDWIASNPGPVGNGWEPYPISLRVVNWIKWLRAGNEPVPGMLDSLASQVRYLSRRLETHLLGNHLWANAKALAFAGSYFSGPEGEAWQATGLRLLARERAEQILADGGHFERSPMYHATVLEDVLDLHQVYGDRDGSWAALATRMLRWLRVMNHPDGEIAFFNDAALGIAPNLAALADYASRLGVEMVSVPLRPVEALAESGYVRLSSGPAVVLVDVAPVGPDYIPGHAHADTLSFEMSLSGRRVLANGGTSTYEKGPLRDAQRGTASHNTVVVDGADSSEVWGGFRVARRARPVDVSWGEAADVLFVEGGHDGYLRLPGRVRHHRRWELGASSLRVIDRVSGRFGAAEARFRTVSPVEWVARDGQLSHGQWYPRFGVTESCKVLVVPVTDGACVTEFLF